ncbi:MAG: hypothetical protein WC523_07165 [Patescibacteria group bacterium]
MNKKIKGSGSGAVKVVTTGAKLAALAGAAYFFFGPEGQKHREHTKAWALKMKAEVVGKLEMAHEISEFAYHKIIDSVAAKHEKGQKADPKKIKILAQDLKKHWQVISSPKKITPSKVAKKQNNKQKKAPKV